MRARLSKEGSERCDASAIQFKILILRSKLAYLIQDCALFTLLFCHFPELLALSTKFQALLKYGRDHPNQC